MDTSISIFIGFLAAFCTTIAFVPQAVKTLRDKDTKSLSLGMYVVFTSGTMLWTIYGVMQQDWAIISANVITTLLALMILIVKLRHG